MRVLVTVLGLLVAGTTFAQESTAASAQDLLDEGWRRVDTRDFAGARIVAEQLGSGFPEHAEEASYVVGVAWSLEGDAANALDVFEQMATTWPDGARADDVAFRSGLALAELGRFREARRALRPLKPYAELQPADQHKIALAEAQWTLRQGRTRKGLRAMVGALAVVPEGSVTWFQAAARTALVEVLVHNSNETDLSVPERKWEKVLTERAQLLAGAEGQLQLTIGLDEPGFVLRQLLLMGEAYLDLGDDLLAAKAPRLSAEEAERYAAQVEELAVTQYVKSTRYFDLGLQLAAQVRWEGPVVDALTVGMDLAEARVEGG